MPELKIIIALFFFYILNCKKICRYGIIGFRGKTTTNIITTFHAYPSNLKEMRGFGCNFNNLLDRVPGLSF